MDLSYSVAHTFPTPVEFGARKHHDKAHA